MRTAGCCASSRSFPTWMTRRWARSSTWNTSDSFLDLAAGDAEEHALLLCNLFLALRKEAYVLMGTEVPEGDHVRAHEKRQRSSVRLWNAHTGKVYSKDDATSPLSACPLISVGMVFNERNVWANVQVGAERPFELDFNLSDAKCWKPFFGPRGYPPPRVIEPLSMAPLVFKRMSEEFRGDLEREVEDHLQREFEDLRAHRPTDWNRSLSNTLKKLLKRFEEGAIGLSPLTREEHDAQLDKFRTTYNLVGYNRRTSPRAARSRRSSRR